MRKVSVVFAWIVLGVLVVMPIAVAWSFSSGLVGDSYQYFVFGDDTSGVPMLVFNTSGWQTHMYMNETDVFYEVVNGTKFSMINEGGSGSSYDQSLNTFDDVVFNQLNTKNISGVYFANEYAESGTGGTNPGDSWVNGICNAWENASRDSVNATGGMIVVPPGTYRENKLPIQVDGAKGGVTSLKHFCLVGAGFWNSVIIVDDWVNESFIELIDEGSCYISGVTINGNKAKNVCAGKPLIGVYDPNDATIRDSFISSSSGVGIQLGNESISAWTVDIINTPVEYCDGYAICVNGTSNTLIQDCTIAHNQDYNLVVYACDGLRVQGCYLASEYHDNVLITNQAGNNTIDLQFVGNQIGNSGMNFTAITLDPGSGHDIRYCQFDDNYIEGDVAFTCTGYKAQYCSIQGNRIIANTAINTTGGFEFVNGTIKDNWGLNPIGYYPSPWYGGAHRLVNLYTGNAAPTNHMNYTMDLCDAYVNVTGGSGVWTNLSSPSNVVLETFSGDCVVFVPKGFKISFDYVGLPTARVYFT